MRNFFAVLLILLALVLSVISRGYGQDNIDARQQRSGEPPSPVSKSRFYALSDSSLYYYRAGQSDRMLSVDSELLTTAQLLKNDSFLMASYKVLGNCSRIKSDYVTAIDYYFKGIALAEGKHGAREILSVFYNNVGDNYNQLGYYEQALPYFKKAENVLAGGSHFQKFLVYVYNNMAETYMNRDNPDLDAAADYLEDAEEQNTVAKDNYIQAAILLDYAIMYSRSEGEEDSANSCFHQAIAFSAAMGDHKHLCNSTNQYGRFLLDLRKYDSAKYYGSYSLRIARENDYKNNIVDNAVLLARIYAGERRPDSAYYFSGMENAYNDSIFNARKHNQLMAITINEQFRENQERAAREEERHKRHIGIQYRLIALGLCSFIILFILLSRIPVARQSRLIVFLGEVALLITFEFINLVVHPSVEDITHESPLLMLLILVVIAALLIPVHHYMQKLVRRLLKVKEGTEGHPHH